MSSRSKSLTKVSNKQLAKEYNVKQKLLLDYYFTKRTDKDMDLVTIFSYLIRDEIGQYYADRFLEDPDIVSVKDKLPGVQRLIINKYLIILLLRFKGITSTTIVKPLFMITNEGTHDDWFKLITAYVMPYIKQKYIMQTIYPRPVETKQN